MSKLLGVIIANGLSSENRVFATLLSERDARYDARVLMHQTDGDGTAHRFAELANNTTTAFDTGWRPSPYHRRGNPLRARVALRYMRGIRELRADAAEYRPDVVYSSQQQHDCRAASRIVDEGGARQIIHLHYTVGPWLRRVVLDRLRTTNHIVAVSDFIRGQVIEHGVSEERVTTIHNAVEPLPPPDPVTTQARRTELGLPDDVFTFGMVSRIDEGKGHIDAISAFEGLAQQRDDVRLMIVGSGRIDREIRERVALSPAADQIVLTGFRTDVPDLLPVLDVLVHPALEDPCPLAVLEAMSAGLPVIGYADGGVPELVESDETGILVERSNVGLLADALRHVCEHEADARSFGAAGRERLATHFTPEQAGRHFADVVDAAC